MSKRFKILENWPKYLLQWGVLLALVLFLTGIVSGEEPANPEAHCPVGGLQALLTYIVKGSLPCSMTTGACSQHIGKNANLEFDNVFCYEMC